MRTNHIATSNPKHIQKKYGFQPPGYYEMGLSEIVEKYATTRIENPGLFFLFDLQIRFMSLQPSLEAATRTPANKDSLLSIRDVVNKNYVTGKDAKSGILSNPLLKVSGEPEPSLFLSVPTEEIEYFTNTLTENIWQDIHRFAPRVTKQMIYRWCETVKDLEKTHMQILASAALLAPRDETLDMKGNQRAATMARLVRSWRGFRTSFYTIYRSTRLGNLSRAIDEMQRAIEGADCKPVSFANLPKRLSLRRLDYDRGRYKMELVDTAEEKVVSLDLIKEENEGELNIADEKANINIDTLMLRHMAEKLPPKERAAVEKDMDGKQLTVAERRAKSRGIQRLKHRPH